MWGEVCWGEEKCGGSMGKCDGVWGEVKRGLEKCVGVRGEK